MTRWEAFALAARIGAAGPRYRVRRMRLRQARQAGHEIMVEDTQSREMFVVGSDREWQEHLCAPEIDLLAQRVRWAGRARAPARSDLVADYERLAALTVGRRSVPLASGRDLRRAVDGLLRAAGGAQHSGERVALLAADLAAASPQVDWMAENMTLEDRSLRAEAAGYSLEIVIETTGGNFAPDGGDFPESERHRAHVTPPSGEAFSVAGGTRDEALAAALYQIEARLGL